jgi:hypothetical protein
MSEAAAGRYRAALRCIVTAWRDPAAVGTTPEGDVGQLWNVQAKDRAFAETLRLAKNVLAKPEQ